MALNPYFSRGTRSEARLHEKLIIESIQMYGTDVVYIPRKIVSVDTILNEDVLSQFSNNFTIEMYLENLDTYDGEGDLMSQFGFTIKDSCKLIVSRYRWNELIGNHGYREDTAKPSPGDLIYLPTHGKTLFEVMHVEDELPFYALGELPNFVLSCELFEYEQQSFETGISDIDEIEHNASSTNEFKLSNEIGKFASDETVRFKDTGGNEVASAEFFGYESPSVMTTGPLTFLSGRQDSVGAGYTVSGEKSASDATIVERIFSNRFDTNTSESPGDNNDFENLGFIDFSESNPFGEPSAIYK